MPQKVIAVNINSASVKSGENYGEMEFEAVNNYLSEGYKIIDVHQIDPSDSSHFFTVTFILEKP